jgi:hypothetical protein
MAHRGMTNWKNTAADPLAWVWGRSGSAVVRLTAFEVVRDEQDTGCRELRW